MIYLLCFKVITYEGSYQQTKLVTCKIKEPLARSVTKAKVKLFETACPML